MKLIINSPLDYTNHIRSLINKYWLSRTQVAISTWLGYNTIKRIEEGINWKGKVWYVMSTDTFDRIIRYMQWAIQEPIEILYTYSEHKK